MKDRMMLTGSVVLLLLLTACAPTPSIDEARASYCSALGDFADAMVKMRQIDQGSTVAEFKEAHEKANSAWEVLTKAAGDLRDAELNELEQAFVNLQRTINDIPQDITLAEAHEKARSAILETTAEYADVATTVCVYGEEQEAE